MAVIRINGRFASDRPRERPAKTGAQRDHEHHFRAATFDQYEHLYNSEIRLVMRALKEMLRARREGRMRRSRKPNGKAKR